MSKTIQELANALKTITIEDALKDYNKLCSLKPEDIKPMTKIGNVAMDFLFFILRLNTKVKGITFPEYYNSKIYLEKPSEKRLYEYGRNYNKPDVKAVYDLFCLYKGSVNAFKPVIARNFYQLYKPTTVLDFCAGWGGRCLGAMSLNINYIGYDTNTSLKPAYDARVATYPHTSTVDIHYEDSSTVDYSALSYDCVFTSPPYYNLERYEHMPAYVSKADFNERFLFPTIRETWKHLKLGGTYALNVSPKMYPDIISILGEPDNSIPLGIRPRHQTSDVNVPHYKEYIYIWLKQSEKLMPTPPPNISTVIQPKKMRARKQYTSIQPSPVSGVGVFAITDIPANTILGEYKGIEMTLKEFKEKYGTDTTYTYSLRFRNKILVGKDEPYRSENISHFMNEGPENVILTRRKIRTSKLIKQGEELFLTYPKNYPRTWISTSI